MPDVPPKIEPDCQMVNITAGATFVPGKGYVAAIGVSYFTSQKDAEAVASKCRRLIKQDFDEFQARQQALEKLPAKGMA